MAAVFFGMRRGVFVVAMAESRMGSAVEGTGYLLFKKSAAMEFFLFDCTALGDIEAADTNISFC